MIVRKLSGVAGGVAGIVPMLFCLLTASATLSAQEQKQIVPDKEAVLNEQEKNTEYLLAQSIKKAKTLMERNDDFLPFGAALFGSGDVRYVWAQNPDEEPKVMPTVALAAVKRSLQANAQRGRILGAASVYRYTPADEEGNALDSQINVEIEYITGHAFVVAFNYDYEQGVFAAGKGVRRDIQPFLFEGTPDGEVVAPGFSADESED